MKSIETVLNERKVRNNHSWENQLWSRTFKEIHIYLPKWKFAIVEGLRSRDQTGVVVDGPAVHVNICRALSNKYEL